MARRLKVAEKRHAEYLERNADEMEAAEDAPSPAAERLAVQRAALDLARREKKSLIANFFAGVCAALDDHARARAVAGEPVRDHWWFAAVGHAVGVGRRHLAEFSLPSIEAVAEAEELTPDVQQAVFHSLRQLIAWQL